MHVLNCIAAIIACCVTHLYVLFFRQQGRVDYDFSALSLQRFVC